MNNVNQVISQQDELQTKMLVLIEENEKLIQFNQKMIEQNNQNVQENQQIKTQVIK